MSCESHFKGTDPVPASQSLYMKKAKGKLCQCAEMEATW